MASAKNSAPIASAPMETRGLNSSVASKLRLKLTLVSSPLESSVIGTLTVLPMEPAELTAVMARAATLTLIEALPPPRLAGNVAVTVAGPPTATPFRWNVADADPAGITTVEGIVKIEEFVAVSANVTLLVCG